MNEKVEIEIFHRRLTVEMEGLTPMEINSLAQKVSERMNEVHDNNRKIADSSKLAILTALEFAAENYRLKEATATDRLVLERKLDELSLSLQSALSSLPKK